MIYELFVVGGMFFWGLIALTFIATYKSLENDDVLAIIFPTLCFFAIFALSNANIEFSAISWKYCVAYLLCGVMTWFSVFNVKLIKIRRFLQENDLKSTEELYDLANLYDRENPRFHLRKRAGEIYGLYCSEPAIDTFFSRILCWPIAIVKFLLGDFLEGVYEVSKKWIITYKDSFLGFKA